MKNFSIAIILVVVLGGGFWLWSQNNATTEPTPTPEENPGTIPPGAVMEDGTVPEGGESTGVQVSSFTMAQVATHNSASSCWSVIDGNIYDLTKWISQHPGGPGAIQGLCGRDGTATFHGQHGDAKKQADILATMKIGVLAQ